MMGSIGFYIFYVSNWALTLLPLSVLYLFADFLYYILYYGLAYRKKVVAANLRNSFPEKSEQELIEIEKKFYRHLTDIFIETFKMMHLRESEHKKRFSVANPEALDVFLERKQDVVAIAGHYNNWEWSNVLSAYLRFQIIPVYKPLHNKQFDSYIKRNRAKYGAIPSPMSNVIREIIRFRKENTTVFIGIVGDQTPAKNEITYWTTFLNQDTPVFTGTERIASKYDMAVVFLNIEKITRGYYRLTFETLFEHTSGLPENAITEAHVRRLEQVIREKPEFWLWSHRRWKHKKPENLFTPELCENR